MAVSPTLTVRGVEVPRLGLGTWQMRGRECVEAVRDALLLGYRHVDTAAAYDNEADVGRGIAAAGVRREDIFVTTKVWIEELAPDRLRESAHRSLRRLGVDRIDLLLIHWPSPDVPLEASLAAMRSLQDEGLIRLLGLSNFPTGLLRRALELAPIANDQVEMHPFLGQADLLEIARQHDLFITAYAPLAKGDVLSDPVIADVARTLGATPAQVALRWLLEHERVVTVPKAASAERRQENLAVLELDLTAEIKARIDALPKDRRHFDPSWAPDWDA